MTYYQDMLERRRTTCELLYQALEPRLRAFAESPNYTDVGVGLKDLIALAKYTMELDLECAGMIRDENLEEDFPTDEKRLEEAERLLASIASKRT